MLIAMRQENLVLAGAINALQARFYHPLIDVKVVAATGTVSNWHIAHFSITDKVVHTVAYTEASFSPSRSQVRIADRMNDFEHHNRPMLLTNELTKHTFNTTDTP